jgi:hypothetical protein
MMCIKHIFSYRICDRLEEVDSLNISDIRKALVDFTY